MSKSKADTSKQQSTLSRFFTKAPTSAGAEKPESKRADAESDVQQAIPSTLNACKRVISPRSPPSSPKRAPKQVLFSLAPSDIGAEWLCVTPQAKLSPAPKAVSDTKPSARTAEAPKLRAKEKRKSRKAVQSDEDSEEADVSGAEESEFEEDSDDKPKKRTRSAKPKAAASAAKPAAKSANLHKDSSKEATIVKVRGTC
jgi:hypothetical protein